MITSVLTNLLRLHQRKMIWINENAYAFFFCRFSQLTEIFGTLGGIVVFLSEFLLKAGNCIWLVQC